MTTEFLHVLSEDAFNSQADIIIRALYAIAAHDDPTVNVDSPKVLQDLVRTGNHTLLPVGDEITVNRAKTITVATGANNTGVTAATIDFETFWNYKRDMKTATYQYIFDGAVWKDTDNNRIVTLTQLGIAITGTATAKDSLIVTVNSEEETFEIADHNTMTPTNPRLKNTLVLFNKNVVSYGEMPFSREQLLYHSVNGLPEGYYKFTLYKSCYNASVITAQDGTYMFHLTKPIPSGGGIRIPAVGEYQSSTAAYTKEKINNSVVYVIGPDRASNTVKANENINGVSIPEWDGTTECTDLGTFTRGTNVAADIDEWDFRDTVNNGYRNQTVRNAHGSNRYSHSNDRQWINSTTVKGNWWTPQDYFDMASSAVTNKNGYLYGVDKDFIDVICSVDNTCALPWYDRKEFADPQNTTSEIVSDKVWLASMTNIFNQANNGVKEGTQFKLFSNVVSTAAQSATIKYRGTTARYWWLRSAFPGNPSIVRGVYTSGALSYGSAYRNLGVVPGLCIG